jgi:hypothetical protein
MDLAAQTSSGQPPVVKVDQVDLSGGDSTATSATAGAEAAKPKKARRRKDAELDDDSAKRRCTCWARPATTAAHAP